MLCKQLGDRGGSAVGTSTSSDQGRVQLILQNAGAAQGGGFHPACQELQSALAWAGGKI